MRGRAGLGAFRRTVAAAGISAALVAITLGADPGGAQPAAPRARSATTSAEGFASGRAAVVSIAPTTGGLSFAFTLGISGAEVAGKVAQGLAHPLDLGLIGTALTGESCTGGDPVLQPDQMPKAVRVDNRSGPVDAEETFVPIAGSDLAAGSSRVTTTMQPASRSTTRSARVALPPVLAIEGGEAVTASEILEDGTRVARSTVELDLSIADLVRIEGIQWTAEHRSGGGRPAEATGSFHGGTVQLLGTPLPLPSQLTSIGDVNTILNPLGFHLEMPQVERVEEPVDLIRVTPLRLRVADGPLGDLAVKQALELTRDMRSDLYDLVEEAYCGASGALLVADIFVGSVSGAGSLVAEVGGVEARSGEVLYEDLFGGTPAPGPGPAEAPTTEIVDPVSSVADLPAAPVAEVPSAAATPPAVDPPKMVLTGASKRCESTHGFGWPPCSTGAALPVGAVGAVVTVGAAVLDLRRRSTASGLVAT